jgi:hypothetical protein
MTDIPRWQAGELDAPGEDVPQQIEKVFEHLPVTMFLGDPIRGPETIIGWSNAWRNKDGTTTIVMSLDEEASEKLKDLADLFKFYAIGFAGVARKEEPQ